MRTLLGWSIKLAIGGVLYVAMTSGTQLRLPDTIMGFKVPVAAQQFVERNAQIADFGQKTTAGFKGIGDSIK